MRIILVDDHQLIRSGLRDLLSLAGHNIVAEAASLSQGRALLATVDNDLIIVDVSLPDGSGLDLINDNGRFIVLTLGDDPTSLEVARARGARAYILKSDPSEHLLAVIEQVALGHKVLPTSKRRSTEVRAAALAITSRELDVLQILARGWSTKEIASHLFLSEATIKTHLASLNRKLVTKSRTAAVARGREHGLI